MVGFVRVGRTNEAREDTQSLWRKTMNRPPSTHHHHHHHYYQRRSLHCPTQQHQLPIGSHWFWHLVNFKRSKCPPSHSSAMEKSFLLALPSPSCHNATTNWCNVLLCLRILNFWFIVDSIGLLNPWQVHIFAMAEGSLRNVREENHKSSWSCFSQQIGLVFNSVNASIIRKLYSINTAATIPKDSTVTIVVGVGNIGFTWRIEMTEIGETANFLLAENSLITRLCIKIGAVIAQLIYNSQECW